MTPDQLRLLTELHDRQILGLADAPEYWCPQLRDTRGGGTPTDPEWHAAGLWRQTSSWGIAMTTPGDYMEQRTLTAPEHVANLTWRQITAWAEALPEERRATARKARMSIHATDEATAVAELLDPANAEPDLEPTLF